MCFNDFSDEHFNKLISVCVFVFKIVLEFDIEKPDVEFPITEVSDLEFSKSEDVH